VVSVDPDLFNEMFQTIAGYIVHETGQVRGVVLVHLPVLNHEIKTVYHVDITGISHFLGQLDDRGGRGIV
jgi:hypothetical protein